ncbi:MAG TPA: DUF4870 domain-containing protein [Candidatus Deferrimicrobium sp.]|nr:DUF4870 domain-containing protein [Candidatus Deferrimicrobium sp.]
MGWKSEDKVLAGVSHLGILVGWVGLIIALGIYLVKRDQSVFVKRSAKQALGFQVCALVIISILALLFGGGMLLGVFTAKLVTTGLLSLVFVKIVLVLLYTLGVWAAIRSFQGEHFKYPLIGEFIDRL